VLVISIAGYFFGNDVVNRNILEQISSTMGSETSVQISQILIKSTESKSTIWGSIIGLLLVGATGVFVELQKSLNFIWHVEVIPKKGIFTVLKADYFIWINISHRFFSSSFSCCQYGTVQYGRLD
jgi:membrane protein